MEKTFGYLDNKIARYVTAVFQPEDQILKEARERSGKHGLPPIQVGDMDGLHLEVLTRATHAKKAVEIGTLGGYSGIHIARGLSPGGKLYTFELSQTHADVARESFNKAGLSDLVEIIVGPAIENLNKINSAGPFDLVFIDADKITYPQYLQWAAEHLKLGGVLIGDNTFAWGMIADESFPSPTDAADVKALREFNASAAQGGRFRATIFPTGEGMTVAVKIK